MYSPYEQFLLDNSEELNRFVEILSGDEIYQMLPFIDDICNINEFIDFRTLYDKIPHRDLEYGMNILDI